MSWERIESELTVVGGGMAGLCAALAAARLGVETVLINDRPVLGGNSSSEVRVWVNGATGGKHNRYAREGGIMEEILLRNKYENPDGNAHLWDAILYDTALAEPHLRVFLNTLVHRVESEDTGLGRSRVIRVGGHQHMSERSFLYASPLFVDATGDGVVAARAGAEWRRGREARSEYGESVAPEEADPKTLGSSIMFYSKRLNRRVPFTPPTFARDFKEHPPPIVAQRTDPEDRRCAYWWFEYGGELDTIRDSEAIRDELWALVYGVWDYIKNSGAFPAEEVANLQLEWVGSIPGKRESRRIMGDYVIRESDLVEQRRFPDAVGHGGWSIDLHPPKGTYDDQGRGSMHWHQDGPYAFPYRCLYAKAVENLFIAGRLMSATHVAFGSLRVQMTLATSGQAVGTAAALCRRHGVLPQEIAASHVEPLQQLLLREDQWVMAVPAADDEDLAPRAQVTAASVQPAHLEEPDLATPLTGELGLHFSLAQAPAALELLLSRPNPHPAGVDAGAVAELAPPERGRLTLEVYSESRPENYIPGRRLGSRVIEVPEGGPRWVRLETAELDPGDGAGLFLILKENPGLVVHGRRRELTGVMACPRRGGPADPVWRPADWVPCFRLEPEPEPPLYGAANVTDGYSRPFGLPHSWLSAPFALAGGGTVRAEDDPEVARPGDPVWLELAWESPREVTTVQLVFNTRLTPWYNHLRPSGERAVRHTVRDYRIEAAQDGGWHTVQQVQGNYQRRRRHRFPPVTTDRLRIVVEATNGVPWAEIFEARVYGPASSWPLTER